jgi:predicted lipoprotein with Yx(FWY)xxD motif
MRDRAKLTIPAVVISLVLAACGSSSRSSSSGGASSPGSNGAGGSAAVVRTASNQRLGATVLVDARGLTLYTLSSERGGKLVCTSASCLAAWRPVTAPGTGKPAGAVASLATIKRPDGVRQVTYRGFPLYTFAHDTKPGDAHGQNIKGQGTWSAAMAGASGASAKPAATTPVPGAPAPSSGY